MANVVVFGAGRGADVAYRYLMRDSEHDVVAFTVDAPYLRREEFHGLPVVPFEDVESRFPPDDYRMFTVLGYQDMNHLRSQKYHEAKQRGYRFVSYISSDIFRIEDLDVGENCFLLDNQSINLDVKIGDNVVMWSSNHIGDMTVIEDHCWISSHCTVAANVVVKQHSFLGIGATVSNHVVVEPESFVGADVLITEDTKPSGVYLPGKSGCVSQDSRAFMKVLEACNKL